MRGAIDEIATELADIHEERAAVAHHVVPEFTRRKFFANENLAAADQGGADRQHATAGVIHWQAVVHTVVRTSIHHAREGMARQHKTEMVDIGGLGQAGGTGGKYEQRL